METETRRAWEVQGAALGPEEAHRAQLLQAMGLLIAGSGALILVAQLITGALPGFPPAPAKDLASDAATILVGATTVWLVRSRRISVAAWLVTGLLLAASATNLFLEERIYADVVGSLGLLVAVALAFALLERRQPWIVFGGAMGVFLAARILRARGALPEPIPRSSSSFPQFSTVAWIVSAAIVAAVLHATMNALRDQAKQLRERVADLRRTQQALRDSEQKLQQIIQGTEALVMQVDARGRVTYVNEAAVQTLGYASEEMIGRLYLRFVHPEDRSAVGQVYAEQVQTGLPSTSLEFRVLTRTGDVRWVSFMAHPITEHGEVVEVSGVAMDISDRKKAEQALVEGEARYRRIFQTAGVPIWEEDFSRVQAAIDDLRAEGVEDFRRYFREHPEFVAEAAQLIEIRDVNRATLKMLKAESKEEVVGSLDQIFTDETNEIFSEELVAIAEGRTYFEGETVNRTLQGERRNVLLTMAIPTEPEQMDSVLVSTMDITDRKQMEEALRESERKFRLVTETIKDVFWISTRGVGEIIYISPAYETLWGRSRQSLYQSPQSFLEALHPDDRDGHLEVVREYHAAGEPYECEYRIVKEDGDVRWIRERGYPVPNASGDVELMTGVCTDITERKEMSDQLRQQERLAAVGQLAGGIAHDFNNILASIILYAQMPLRRPELAPGTRRALETILEESNRAADVVSQILDFSRRAMMETEPLSLVDLIEDTLSLLRRTLPEDIELSTDVAPRPCIVEADATRLRQVLMNLVVNARDAMPDGGGLTIGVRSVEFGPEDEAPLSELIPGRWARLSVSDTGTGMAAEIQEHLFEPFFTTKEEGKGTGLGLAQVYGIVKQHEGYIDVRTAVDEGSTFTVYLPLQEGQWDQKEPEAEDRPVEGQGETILVVEDAERILEAIRAGLESLNYRVLTAATGREAMETAPLEEVDLVLTDVVMPEMGGRDLLRELRARSPGLKVIAMTGYMMGTETDELEGAGFAHMLRKPFTMEELTSIVQDALAGEGD